MNTGSAPSSTIVFAKFLGVGVTAFIFDVTRPKLLEMEWFEKLYELVLALRAKAAALVDPIKLRIREILRGDGDGWSSRTLRLIQRFRKSVHEARWQSATQRLAPLPMGSASRHATSDAPHAARTGRSP